MSVFVPITLSIENNVAGGASDIQQLPIVPSGGSVILKCFRGYDPTGGRIALQWGNAGDGWTTIFVGVSSFLITYPHSVVGDGTSRYRVVRTNGGLVSTAIFAAIEGNYRA